MSVMRPEQEFDFMKEKIKERPINKKKLIRRTIITASMAVVFGLVACLTFLVLEPLFSNWLYPEEEPGPIVLPAETEEMLPEDMLMEETESETETEPETVIQAELELNVEDYQLLYEKLYALAEEKGRAMVQVTGVKEDVDWFNNPYETKGQTSGVIVGDNGKEYMILVDKGPIENVETIRVRFQNGVQASAQVKGVDSITGLAVIGVVIKDLPQDQLEGIAIAELGSSGDSKILGRPVMALGSPGGTGNSIAYGMITSVGSTLHLPDSAYKLLTTDIYASPQASGVLFNLHGQVIGMINENYTNENMQNQLCAIGITELKGTLSRLSVGDKIAYIGIYGTNVTEEANEELQVPMGAYVTEIAMGSPAMQAGIQSGDILVKLGETEINSYQEYIKQLEEVTTEESVSVTIMRQGQQEYREIELHVTPHKAE